MGLLEKLLASKVRHSGLSKEDTSKLTKAEILQEVDADTIQLIAAMPNNVMDSVWRVLGVEDGRDERKPESE